MDVRVPGSGCELLKEAVLAGTQGTAVPLLLRATPAAGSAAEHSSAQHPCAHTPVPTPLCPHPSAHIPLPSTPVPSSEGARDSLQQSG